MLRLNTGDIVQWDKREYVVAAISPMQVMLSELGTTGGVWIDIPWLTTDAGFTVDGMPLGALPDLGVEWGTITPEERAAAEYWVPHLNEVETGRVDPDDPACTPRPGYESPLKKVRRALKLEELKAAQIEISDRTLQRKLADYKAAGVYGLIDLRGRAERSSGPSVDPEVSEALLGLLAARVGEPTIATTSLINRLKVDLNARSYAGVLPSDQTLRRLVAAYDPKGLTAGRAKTRQNESNVPARMFTPTTSMTPGQVVEIDTTPVNALVIMPDGKIERPHLTVAIDVATRSILGFSLVPTGTTGLEHADLLARILRPRQCSLDAPSFMRLDKSENLPAAAMLAADERQTNAIAVPYIVPESITTDRGMDYLSKTFIAACNLFGISVKQAPGHSPTYKGHIERFFRSIETLWMQHLPGYIGNAPENRGAYDELDGLLTLREMQDSFQEFWVRVWQNKPHDGLRDRGVLSRKLSPNQVFSALFTAGAGVVVPIDKETYIKLMPLVERAISSSGIKVNHRTYDSSELDGLRGTKATSHSGLWQIRIDPYDDDRVWVKDPRTSEWIECISDSFAGTKHPFGSAMRAVRNMPDPDPSLANTFAQETIADAQKRLSGAKKQRRKDAVLAQRDQDRDPRPGPVIVPEARPAYIATGTDYAAPFELESPDERNWDA